jgi:hypothetical protein
MQKEVVRVVKTESALLRDAAIKPKVKASIARGPNS